MKGTLEKCVFHIYAVFPYHAAMLGLPYMLERAGLDVQQGNITLLQAVLMMLIKI